MPFKSLQGYRDLGVVIKPFRRGRAMSLTVWKCRQHGDLAVVGEGEELVGPDRKTESAAAVPPQEAQTGERQQNRLHVTHIMTISAGQASTLQNQRQQFNLLPLAPGNFVVRCDESRVVSTHLVHIMAGLLTYT